MKFLWAMLSLGQLYTDDDINNDDNSNADNDNTNDDTWWKNHDCIGSLACMPNEPKTRSFLSPCSDTHVTCIHIRRTNDIVDNHMGNCILNQSNL